jgi:hypothetical protein
MLLSLMVSPTNFGNVNNEPLVHKLVDVFWLVIDGAGNPRILLADWVDFVGWFGMIIKNNDNGHLIGSKLVSFAVIYLGIRHSQS